MFQTPEALTHKPQAVRIKAAPAGSPHISTQESLQQSPSRLSRRAILKGALFAAGALVTEEIARNALPNLPFFNAQHPLDAKPQTSPQPPQISNSTETVIPPEAPKKAESVFFDDQEFFKGWSKEQKLLIEEKMRNALSHTEIDVSDTQNTRKYSKSIEDLEVRRSNTEAFRSLVQKTIQDDSLNIAPEMRQEVEDFAMAIIFAESAGNIKAGMPGDPSYNPDPDGAIGLMQIKPSVANSLYPHRDSNKAGERLDEAEFNVRVGVTYLRDLTQKYPDFGTLVAAYNMGEGNIDTIFENGLIPDNGTDPSQLGTEYKTMVKTAVTSWPTADYMQKYNLNWSDFVKNNAVSDQLRSLKITQKEIDDVANYYIGAFTLKDPNIAKQFAAALQPPLVAKVN